MPHRGRLFLLPLTLTAICTNAFADSGQTTSIHELLERFRTPTTGISISVISYEQKADRNFTSESRIYFVSNATYEKNWIYIANYKGSKWVSSLIGDSEQLWSLDATKNQYSTQTYGTGVKSFSTLFNLVKAQNTPQAWGGIRLLEDILSPKYPWTPWLPMMSGPTYFQNETIFRQGNTIEHRFLAESDSKGDYLGSVILGDYSPSWNTERVITPTVGLPENLKFKFETPRGWTQVVGIGSQKVVPR